MFIERSTLTLITVVAALAGGLAAWWAVRSGHDAVVFAPVAYAVTAGVLGRFFGGAGLVTAARSLLLLVGGVLGVTASLLLAVIGIRLVPTVGA
jgi:hypothetical protein